MRACSQLQTDAQLILDAASVRQQDHNTTAQPLLTLRYDSHLHAAWRIAAEGIPDAVQLPPVECKTPCQTPRLVWHSMQNLTSELSIPGLNQETIPRQFGKVET